MRVVATAQVSYWPFTTGRLFRADRRKRGIADMAGPAACPAQSRLTRLRHWSLKFAALQHDLGTAFTLLQIPAVIVIVANHRWP